jgi:hypothetical protein
VSLKQELRAVIEKMLKETLPTGNYAQYEAG